MQSYEQRENKIFYYRDERLFDFIERQWDELKSNKKILQQTKVSIILLFFRKECNDTRII